jgi:predicted metal-binding transcription factor (methanogenesis marker protein 9)
LKSARTFWQNCLGLMVWCIYVCKSCGKKEDHLSSNFNEARILIHFEKLTIFLNRIIQLFR